MGWEVEGKFLTIWLLDIIVDECDALDIWRLPWSGSYAEDLGFSSSGMKPEHPSYSRPGVIKALTVRDTGVTVLSYSQS